MYLEDTNSNPLSFSGTKFPLTTTRDIKKKSHIMQLNKMQFRVSFFVKLSLLFLCSVNFSNDLKKKKAVG